MAADLVAIVPYGRQRRFSLQVLPARPVASSLSSLPTMPVLLWWVRSHCIPTRSLNVCPGCLHSIEVSISPWFSAVLVCVAAAPNSDYFTRSFVIVVRMSPLLESPISMRYNILYVALSCSFCRHSAKLRQTLRLDLFPTSPLLGPPDWVGMNGSSMQCQCEYWVCWNWVHQKSEDKRCSVETPAGFSSFPKARRLSHSNPIWVLCLMLLGTSKITRCSVEPPLLVPLPFRRQGGFRIHVQFGYCAWCMSLATQIALTCSAPKLPCPRMFCSSAHSTSTSSDLLATRWPSRT